MSDKANCKNCIHFDEIKRRCCLNDGSWVQKECYFRRNNRKPMGNDVIFEKQGKIIKDLQSQLDHQKAMWNELKEWAKDLLKGCDLILDRQQINNDLYNRTISQKRIIINMLSKMQELEKGGNNEN